MHLQCFAKWLTWKWSEVKVSHLCPTRCDPTDSNVTPWTPGSSICGILQARILAVGSCCPSAGDLTNPGIEPRSPALQADSLQSEPPEQPGWHVTAYYMLVVLMIILIDNYSDMFDLAPMPPIILYIWLVIFLKWSFLATIPPTYADSLFCILFHDLYSFIP